MECQCQIALLPPISGTVRRQRVVAGGRKKALRAASPDARNSSRESAGARLCREEQRREIVLELVVLPVIKGAIRDFPDGEFWFCWYNKSGSLDPLYLVPSSRVH